MKLHANQARYLNVFTAYGEDYVKVNDQRWTLSVVVLPTQVIEWRPTAFAELQSADFDGLLAHQPEIILLGTGPLQQFPHPKLWRNLRDAGLTVDAMDNSALCRTFNILVAEDRRVLAALTFT